MRGQERGDVRWPHARQKAARDLNGDHDGTGPEERRKEAREDDRIIRVTPGGERHEVHGGLKLELDGVTRGMIDRAGRR